MNKQNDIGIIYLAFGRPYLAMALVSFHSVRKTNPKMPVCILTNVCDKIDKIDGWIEGFDVWKYMEMNTSDNRKIKTQLYKFTPFEKTLYLDSDTIVVGDLSKTTLFLDYFDLCLKLNGGEQTKAGRTDIKVLNEKATINELPHWNGGVVFFKKDVKVNNFFNLWYEFYEMHENKYDQISLVEALFRSDCRVLSLDSRWNYKRKNIAIPIKKNVKILHYVTDMTSRSTPKIDYRIIKQILEESKKIPGGEKQENYSEIKAFFKKINDFRSKGNLFNILKKKLSKKLNLKKKFFAKK